jgi:tellurite resistance protein TerC
LLAAIDLGKAWSGLFDSVGSPQLWAGFLIGVVILLAIDLGVLHKDSHRVTVKEAAIWSVVWVALSLAFNAFVWVQFGRERGLEFLSAYLIEKSLSVDNIFVFIIIFRYMKVKREYLHRVLFMGIFGALVLRALFILVGLSLIQMFTWSLYVFGGFLFYTGIKLLLVGDDDPDEEQGDSWVKRKAEQVFRVTKDFEGPIFFLRRDGKLMVTTLFVTLLMVETADVVFALDSIPAIFGISRDPFIVFTSNVCAVMGLRAMFFLLEDVIDRFHYLQIGLGFVLAFIGFKMLVAEGLGNAGLYWAGVPKMAILEPIHVPIGLSLGLVGSVLLISVLASLLISPPAPDADDAPSGDGD